MEQLVSNNKIITFCPLYPVFYYVMYLWDSNYFTITVFSL